MLVLVRPGDQAAQRGEIAEVRVQLRQVRGPVAVIAVDARIGVDVAHDGRDPQGGDAERREVVEVIDDALPVAALVARERGAIEAKVVAGIAVGEAVDENLVDHLVAPVGDMAAQRDGGDVAHIGEASADGPCECRTAE